MNNAISQLDLKKELLKTSDIAFDKHNFENLILGQGEYKVTHSTFTEVSFKGAFMLDKVNLSHGMSFAKSIFQDIVVLRDIVIDRYDRLKVPDSVSLIFSDCNFNAEVKLLGANTSIERNIVFENCVFEKGIEIDSIIVSVEGLTFENCTIKEKLDIFRSRFKQSIRFSGNTVESYIRLTNLESGSILFTGSNTVSGHLHINSCKLVQGITFNDGTFKDAVNFSLIETRSWLSIFGSTFEKEFTINFHAGTVQPSRGIAKFSISTAKFENGFYVFGVQEVLSTRPLVEELKVQFSSKLTGSILFQNLDVGTLILGGYNTAAKVTLKQLHVNQMKINGIINEGGLIFSNLRASLTEWVEEANNNIIKKSAFYIDDANLGKAQFFQTNFRSFEKLVFHNVILTEISTSLVTWFSKEQLEDGQIAQSVNALKAVQKSKNKIMVENQRKSLLAALSSRKEIYRQLKYASQKQGDTPLSLEFQRHEMEYYQQIIKHQKPRQWSEHLILWSSNSNNFGQNWLKAFVYLVIFSLVSYLPIGFLTSENLDYSKFARSCSDIGFNFKVIFWDNFKSWFVLLNPAHRVSDLAKADALITGWVYFWDMISRVIVAYFIFQMVSAFRKFSK